MTGAQFTDKYGPNVTEDIVALIGTLQPDALDYIRGMKREELFMLLRTLGRTLRNAFRSGKYPSLMNYCFDLDTDGTRSFDSISAHSLEILWDYLCCSETES
jgi:hypothetical protein